MATFRRLAILSLTAASLLAAAPAMAGQDLTIELQNNLKPSQPLYPRLTLRATDWYCWYANDLENGPAAPAGGGYATLTSEVKNTFFSFCNPPFSPMKDSLARWVQFKIMSQASPGAEWKPVTWGNTSTFFLTYFKLPMDVRGYHFQVAGPGAEVMDTPAGPACVSFDPNGMLLNYSDLYRMKVSPAGGDTCPASAAQGRIPNRTVSVRVGRTKSLVVGQVVKSADSRWRVDECTSDHFDAGVMRTEEGPGSSRWQAVEIRGISKGTDRCTLTLLGDRGRELLAQRVTVTVR